jgi:S1-C subfamily serine protease
MTRFWQHFVSNGHRHGPVYLGIQGYAVRLDAAVAKQCNAEEGVLVRMIQPGSMAEDAGILEGDIILALGDHPIGTADELFAIVEAMRSDVAVPVILVRHGRRFERLLVMPRRGPKVKYG